jgi:hypothetical protein
VIPILHAGFTQWSVSAFTMHNQALPPVPPLPALPAVPGLIEGPVPLGWPPGVITHKVSTTVLVDGGPGVQSGHDVGYVIPHFAIPMNALCAVHTVFSKHKLPYSVSTVLIEGKEAGSYVFFLGGIICAHPVSMPTGVLLLFQGTVWTSFSLADFLRALGTMALEALFDLVFNRLTAGTWSGRSPPSGAARPILAALRPSPFRGTNHLLQVLGGLTLREMVTDGGAGLLGRYILQELGNKGLQHVLKSWVATPLVRDLPRGEMGVGRGAAGVKFFDADWW